MDDKNLRFQCLQQANQLLGSYNMPGTKPEHTPDEVLALAVKLYTFCTTGTV